MEEDPLAGGWVSVHEVALAFAVSDSTVRNWIGRGWLPGERRPGTRVFRLPSSVLTSPALWDRLGPARGLTSHEVEVIVARLLRATP